jgi:hydroxymethylbilane synthase
MSISNIRIATRESPLALWQAEHVRRELIRHHPGISVELVAMTTQGDRILDTPLTTVGGKGLFIKELEHALLNGDADIAVHSMKDVTVDMPEGLALPVIMKRADHRDVFISNRFQSLDELPDSACIGTSSLRRQCQLRAYRPDLELKDLRGNVGTRLRKLDEDRFDAIVLAAAGIIRLGFEERIREYLEADIMLSAIGQGAIGIEMRAVDPDVLSIIKTLDDEITKIQLMAERAFSRKLYGGCQLPIAAYAKIDSDQINLRGLVASPDGKTVIYDELNGTTDNAEPLGLQLAEILLNKGADAILRELLHE